MLGGQQETFLRFFFQRIEIRRTTENGLSTLFLKCSDLRKPDMACIDTALMNPLIRTESTVNQLDSFYRSQSLEASKSCTQVNAAKRL